jgi:hypothetical protein
VYPRSGSQAASVLVEQPAGSVAPPAIATIARIAWTIPVKRWPDAWAEKYVVAIDESMPRRAVQSAFRPGRLAGFRRFGVRKQRKGMQRVR